MASIERQSTDGLMKSWPVAFLWPRQASSNKRRSKAMPHDADQNDGGNEIQRPDIGLEFGSGDGAPSYKICSRLRPAMFLAVSRVIDKIKPGGSTEPDPVNSTNEGKTVLTAFQPYR